MRVVTRYVSASALKSGLKRFAFKQASESEKFYAYKPSKAVIESFNQVEANQLEIDKLLFKASPDVKKFLKRKFVSDWTFNSCSIEGNPLTLSETEALLESRLSTSSHPLKEQLEIVNHARAIEWLQFYASKEVPLSMFVLKQLHELLYSGIDSGANPVGDFKTQPHYVVEQDGSVIDFVAPLAVSAELEDLLNWIELAESDSSISQLQYCIVSHYNFMRIHPFFDGNGRISRLLMNILLLRSKYHPAIIEVTKRQGYTSALNQASKGDLDPFALFICDSIVTPQETTLKLLKSNTK